MSQKDEVDPPHDISVPEKQSELASSTAGEGGGRGEGEVRSGSDDLNSGGGGDSMGSHRDPAVIDLSLEDEEEGDKNSRGSDTTHTVVMDYR